MIMSSFQTAQGHAFCKLFYTAGAVHDRLFPCQGKDREFGNFAKTQEILFAQVVNSLILDSKVKDIAIFAVKISIFFQ